MIALWGRTDGLMTGWRNPLRRALGANRRSDDRVAKPIALACVLRFGLFSSPVVLGFPRAHLASFPALPRSGRVSGVPLIWSGEFRGPFVWTSGTVSFGPSVASGVVALDVRPVRRVPVCCGLAFGDVGCCLLVLCGALTIGWRTRLGEVRLTSVQVLASASFVLCVVLRSSGSGFGE